MFCDKCGKNHATTHIKTVVNGIVTEQNLCSECAAESGYKGFGGASISEMLSTMLGGNNFNLNGVKCSLCGTDFAEISKTGKVGCSECYKTFKKELLPYLRRIHGSVKHTGKVPNIDVPKKDTIEELKVQLIHLIEEENYEEAAVVRDKIKELEGK